MLKYKSTHDGHPTIRTCIIVNPCLLPSARRPTGDRLVVEHGGFRYDSDAYNDDLPYWNMEHGKAHLVIPYTLDVNDMRFATPQGFNTGDQFFTYLKDTLDFLLEVRLARQIFSNTCITHKSRC